MQGLIMYFYLSSYCLHEKTHSPPPFCSFFLPCLNGQNTSYGTLYTTSTFNSKAINVALPVGSVAASADVAPSGAATYTIPIAVPPGTNGVVPSVSITYNSMGGNGPVGQGWGISGLSAITRTPRNVYHEMYANAVELSSYDKFALDGVRLIVKTGTYGADGTVYGTEAEGFATITSKGAMGGGPQWFEVIMKDGTIMEYGNTSDSRCLNHNNTKVLFWKLSKVKYNDGNYIEYKYTTTDSDSRIDEIKYTGNSTVVPAQLPYNTIKFNYSIREDVVTSYEAQTPIKSKYLLDNITITAESNAFKIYEFKYAKNNTNTSSFLVEVIEKGSNGIALNSTIFKYGDEPMAFPAPTSSSVFAGQQVDVFSGDFDADGYSDIMAATRVMVGNNNNITTHTEYKVYKRTATDPTYTLWRTQSINSPGHHAKTVGASTARASYNYLIGDYFGNGADDVATYLFDGTSEPTNLVLVKIYDVYGTANFANINPPGLYGRIKNHKNFIRSGDFNGDGVSDLFIVTQHNTTNGTAQYIYYGASSSNFSPVALNGNANIPSSMWADADRIEVVDFNGDGKSDLMIIDEYFCEVFTIDGLTAKRIYQGGFPTKDHLLFFGDFNGDRKTDLLVRTSLTNNNAAWNKAISTGTTFIETPFTFSKTPSITQVYTGDELLISDYNGDGKMDIGHGWAYKDIYNQYDGTSRIDMYYSKGDAFFSEQYTHNGTWSSAVSGSSDMNSDGRSDWVLRSHYTDPFYIFSFKKNGKDLLLEKAKNGVGHETAFTYKRMTETANSFYTQGGYGTHPLNNVQFPIHLVQEFKVQNGVGGDITAQYTYEEAKLHKEGKALLGFKKFNISNISSGIKTSIENEFNTTFFSPALLKTQTRLISNNSLLNEVTNTNQFINLGSKRFWVKLTTSVENKAFEGITVTNNTTYDANGYVSNLKNGTNTVTMFTNGTMNGFNQYLTYTLGNTKSSTNTYYFGIPTRYLTVSVQDLNLTWNYTTMNLTSRNDAIKAKTENFVYDNLNRLTSATVTGLTAQTVGYATNGNITSKTDAGTFTYNGAKIHAVESVTNPSGNITTNTQNISYTAFFQPSTVTEGTNQLDFTYAPDYERIKTVAKVSGTVTNTRYFFGNYEKDITGGTTRHIHYVSNGQSLIAIVVRIGTTDTYNYVYTDHLGSILTVTNNTGAITEQQNFDAWGRKRNVNDWTYTGVQPVSNWLYRGYTGHEHLPQFGLVNMNGRVYDPVLGRMLSVDNYASSGYSTQGFNRYSYANGNPLKYTDPSGESIILGILVAAFINTTIQVGKNGGTFDNWSWGSFAGAVVGGAVGGIIAPALASAQIGGFYAGAITGGASGFASNLTTGIINRDPVRSIVWNSLFKGAFVGGIVGGIVGGLDASLKGNRFIDGRSKIPHSVFHSDGGGIIEDDGSYYNFEKNAMENQVNTADTDNVPRMRKTTLNKGYEGSVSVSGRVRLTPGETGFYMKADGKLIYESSRNGAYSFSVPASTKTLEWGINGAAVYKGEIEIIPSDLKLEGYILPAASARLNTTTIIRANWRSFGGFLFWP